MKTLTFSTSTFHKINKRDAKKTAISQVLFIIFALILSGCSPTPDSKSATETSNPKNNQSNNQTAKTTANNSTKKAQPAVTILALGDSLTEGLGVTEADNYPTQLQDKLSQSGFNVKVVNSGLSGETSTGLVNRLDWALKTNPDITILTIGANDAMRGIAIDTIDSNIRQSIKRIQKTGSRVVLGGMQIYDNMGDDYVKAFSAMYEGIAKDMGVTFIPFFLDGVAGDVKLNQNDRIHPNAEGYTRIVENNILPVLTPEINSLLATKANDTKN